MSKPVAARPIRASHIAAAKLSVAAAHKRGEQPPEWIRVLAASSPQRGQAGGDQTDPPSGGDDASQNGNPAPLPRVDAEHDSWLEIFGVGSPTSGIGELTMREVEVLRLVGDGLTDRQIAERLQVAVTTVRNHLLRVYSKLDVSSRSELAQMGAGIRLS